LLHSPDGLRIAKGEADPHSERLSVPRVELSVKPSSHTLAGRHRAAAADHKPPASPFSALLDPPPDAPAPARDRSQPPASSRTAARSVESRAESAPPRSRDNPDSPDRTETPDPQQAASPDAATGEQTTTTAAEAQPGEDRGDAETAKTEVTENALFATDTTAATSTQPPMQQPAAAAALQSSALADAPPDAGADGADLLAADRAKTADAALAAQTAVGAQADGKPGAKAAGDSADADGSQRSKAAPSAAAGTATAGTATAGTTSAGTTSAGTAAAGTAPGAEQGDGASSQSHGDPAHPESKPEGKPEHDHTGAASRRDGAAPASDRSSPQAHDESKAADAAPSRKPPVDPVQLGSLPHGGDRQPTSGVANTTPAATSQSAAAVPIAGLAVEIAARAQAGHNRFEIRLDPPELGRIDVRLDVDHSGHVTSRLVVDRAETLDLLRRDAPELERALQQAGLKTSENGLQFTLRDQAFAGRDDERAAPEAARVIVPDNELEPVATVPGGYVRV
jgi:flagellar hook-length control protein FliK